MHYWALTLLYLVTADCYLGEYLNLTGPIFLFYNNSSSSTLISGFGLNKNKDSSGFLQPFPTDKIRSKTKMSKISQQNFLFRKCRICVLFFSFHCLLKSKFPPWANFTICIMKHLINALLSKHPPPCPMLLLTNHLFWCQYIVRLLLHPPHRLLFSYRW